jgi:mycothiol synthase
MIQLRVADSDADLEAWREVRKAVLPNERALTVERMRAQAARGQLWLLAELDGDVAGAGVVSRSDAGGALAQPRVVPWLRRQGVGAALLRALGEHASKLGHEGIRAHVEDPDAMAFAERFGFRETMRQIEQVRSVALDEQPAVAPTGVDIVSLADRSDLVERLFTELAREALTDLAVDRPILIDDERWRTEWRPSVDAAFVALEDGEIVGMAGLEPDPDHAERAENVLTAVRRDRRGRGIARGLKQHTIHWASTHGLTEVYTWTQTGNEAMQELNRSLRYVDRAISINVVASLPLR